VKNPKSYLSCGFAILYLVSSIPGCDSLDLAEKANRPGLLKLSHELHSARLVSFSVFHHGDLKIRAGRATSGDCYFAGLPC